MDVITSPEALQALLAGQRRAGRTIGFVPTMGALHDGHLSLIDLARSHADVVVVSAFVNPLQFDDKSDFDRYPQAEAADAAMCSGRSVDVLYRPSPAAMYPAGFSTTVHVSGLSEILEGASRPGHFDGVATVVAKLLNAADPDVSVFGAKDFQQVAVIRRMVADLDFRTRILVAPTVRESDGLAMSSRNVRLGSDARSAAVNLHRGLSAAHVAFASGTTDSNELLDHVVARATASPLVTIDYVRIADPNDLSVVETARPGDVVLIAAIVDGVRLIDNVVLGDSGTSTR